MSVEMFSYDNKIVRNFAIAALLWGAVGMLVGLIAAIELYLPGLSFDLPYFTFSRIRPLHTNAVIFAFVGNGIFMGVYYSLQRLCKARMYSDTLSSLHFWGWQLIILAAAISLPLGFTTSKEYAELEWPIDILIALVWIVFGLNMFGTIAKRREKHLYVAIWFYIATWVTVTLLHVVNSLALPVSFMKSYSVYAGIQDALVQWWYGHNAVAFFLTTPYLGLMYYFMPKAADRPVFSYRLSIVHFWALVFLYIWAGPHHLLYSSLPDWAQSLGTAFSIMLLAPSWGGMLNGLLTLRGAWDKVREEVVLKFMVVAVTAYGMATFEGPLLSIKSVNALSHFTDWTIAHVHIGALGWNGFLTFGILYWMIPRIFQTKLYSDKLANLHFWIGTIGIVVYALPMYFAGITQGLMWKEFTPEGILKYPNFLETVQQLIPMYIIRSVGGALYIVGVVIGIYNIFKTMKLGKLLANEPAQAQAIVHEKGQKQRFTHRWLEGKAVPFTILSIVAVVIGGVVEMLPTFLIKSNIPTITAVHPLTPLEVEGRDIYIREGCNNCHSQLIRPFRSETERYGEYSKAGEFVYDHPFLWGSKRTGPDLARVGGKYPDAWHYNHMIDPTSMSPGSIMPRFPWLAENELDTSSTASKIRVLRALGVPYSIDYDQQANADLAKQSEATSAILREANIDCPPNKEIVALIAYLQRLGADVKNAGQVANATGGR